jgi:branched-chain amino acid transport system substrate-binding protein
MAGCREGPTRFGAVLPLSGENALYGRSVQRGIDLAYEKHRLAAGRNAVQLITVDSASDPEKARKEFQKLLDAGVIAVIGGVTSAEAIQMVPVADTANRVLLSPSASSPQLSGISSNFFRVYPSDSSEGTVMARYAYDTLRLNKVVVIAKEEPYAKGIQKVFSDEFRRKGGQVVELIEFPPFTRDFAALADRATGLKPDGVYLAGYAEEISRLIRELRAHQYSGLILTTSAVAAGSTLADLGKDAEGILFTQISFQVEGNVSPQVKEFVSEFRKRYDQDPDLYAAHGYDAFNVLLEAKEKGGSSGTSFWKGMRNIHDYPGVTGTIQFDEKGDVQKFPRVYVVQGGRAIDRDEQLKRQREEALKRIEEIERQLRELQRRGSGN